MDLGSNKLNLTPDMLLPDGMRLRQPGIYPDVSDEIYHAYDAASQTHVKTLAERSPMHAREAMLNPPEVGDVAKRNRVIGSALHALVLQPQRFDKLYVVASQCAATTGKGKRCENDGKVLTGGEWFCGTHTKGGRHVEMGAKVADRLLAEGFVLLYPPYRGVFLKHPHSGEHVRISGHAPDDKTLAWMLHINARSIRVDLPPYGSDDPRTIITGDMLDTIRRMRDALMRHEIVRFVVEHPEAERELTVLWNYHPPGMGATPPAPLLCKSRLDGLLRQHGLILDLKTTVDASRDEFERSIYNYGYHKQGWFYQAAAQAHGIDVSDYNLVAVEKEPPYGVQVFRLDDQSLNLGGEEMLPALDRYAACYAANEWPGYPCEGAASVQDVGVPEWVLRRAGKL